MTSLDSFEIPLVQATNENLKGYGYLVDDYDQTEIEITTWPKKDGEILRREQVMREE